MRMALEVAKSPIIRFENVSKSYRVGSGRGTLRDAIPAFFGHVARRKSWTDDARYIWALKDVSFEVAKGEALGIIGPNGAGKTTILKLLSGITKATRGRMDVRGRVSSLIELGAGFHPDLTGRENIHLNASILGLKGKQIGEKFDRIVEFSGLSDFIDTPVKRYSSGMYLRLGFSVAAHVEPHVLLIDELLAVGDMSFQTKCLDRMRYLSDKGTTIVFVSHNLDMLESFCTRGLFLLEGRMMKLGSPHEATQAYKNHVAYEALQKHGSHRQMRFSPEQRYGSGEILITDVKILDSQGMERHSFQVGDTMTIRISFAARREIRNPVFGVAIFRADGLYCSGVNTKLDNFPTGNVQGPGSITLTYPTLGLLPSAYRINVASFEQTGMIAYDYIRDARAFTIEAGGIRDHGIVHLEHDWNFPSA